MATTDTLLKPEACVMLLLDFQAGLGFGVESASRQVLLNNGVALARTAVAFNVPDNADNEFADRGFVQKRRDDLTATHHPDILTRLAAQVPGKPTKLPARSWVGLSNMTDGVDAVLHCAYGYRRVVMKASTGAPIVMRPTPVAPRHPMGSPIQTTASTMVSPGSPSMPPPPTGTDRVMAGYSTCWALS